MSTQTPPPASSNTGNRLVPALIAVGVAILVGAVIYAGLVVYTLLGYAPIRASSYAAQACDQAIVQDLQDTSQSVEINGGLVEADDGNSFTYSTEVTAKDAGGNVSYYTASCQVTLEEGNLDNATALTLNLQPVTR